jgi:hypothetical protein
MPIAIAQKDGTIIGVGAQDIMFANDASVVSTAAGFAIAATAPTLQLINATGNITVTVPNAAVALAGLSFWVCNTGNTNTIVVTDVAGNNLCDAFQNQARFLVCDGQSWRIGSFV